MATAGFTVLAERAQRAVPMTAKLCLESRRMHAIAAGLSDTGRQRVHNEDRVLLLPEFNVFVVADGMGGHSSGDVASRMAANSVADYFRRGARASTELMQHLSAALMLANERIFACCEGIRAARSMGTTIVAGAYDPEGKTFHVAYAGDSRCYRMRD